ncbi:putative cdc25 family phosphatase ibp1 protein [Lasiodiplodia theobromae]|uniref:CDC25-like phosphatase YCH1 n=1 Tax=Lasiodiplodia theobromae TaxID=45133 RepID=A0A5N5DTG4_9PEZI|nr:M-phase inducer phosphatase [Lasiodiplodia theobromae]KAB2580242.1 CDC25-like phosphatase YCH1 [Lasiodiplodia theobromae]KAF4541206.1 M-phase inducer phosphatase [Lasiodiplodia theobromae]KAF9632254.1 putative cdc25 family phosphatase ibp1 protein [Lasiodiplodia theobromae]
MSSATIASLKRIDADALYALLKQAPAKPLFASSSASVAEPPTNVRSDAESAATTTTTSSPSPSASVAVIDVRDSDFFGGHIRGCTNVPTSALDYKLPELVRQLKGTPTVVFHCALSQQRGPSAALRYLRERARLLGDDGDGEGQDVCVLEGGFVRWQEKYGMDETVTEGYKKDIWEYGY